MVDTESFKVWIRDNTKFSDAVVCDTASRIKRADSILEWSGDETYLFYLEKEQNFIDLSVSVKSQLRRAVKLYNAYAKELQEINNG